MQPKPLDTNDPGHDGAPARPQLKIAARAAQDVRSADQTAADVIQDEVRQWHGEWRGTLDGLRQTLSDLARTCETEIGAREQELAGIIERIAASATAQADASAQRVRAQAQAEIAELREEMARLSATVDTLRTDLDAERDHLKAVTEQLQTDTAARIRAEGERDEARAECQMAVSAADAQIERLRADNAAHRSELAAARQQLEAASAERTKLLTTFQEVQRALSLGPDRGPAVASPETASTPAAPSTPPPARVVPGPAVEVPHPLAEAHPEAVEDARHLLQQVEEMYGEVLKSGRSPMEVVDALTSYLRYAKDVLMARSNLPERDAEVLFEQQVDLLLDLKAGTSFGRHLSISAYPLRKPPEPPAV